MPLNDTTFGFLILGLGLLFVLGLVFAVTSRVSRAPRAAVTPPPGVHLPPGSWLPTAMAFGGALIFAGLASRPDDALANWIIFIPGVLVFVAGVVSWVRAANHEWSDTERGSHDDTPGH